MASLFSMLKGILTGLLGSFRSSSSSTSDLKSDLNKFQSVAPGSPVMPSDPWFPEVQDDLVSAPSTAESYAEYSNTSAYDDYLSMLQKGADIGLFSTAQDVVNEAQKDRLFQSLEAEKERSWYEDLANTSYQRQVKDLQAAGLNPILGFANLGTGAATAHSSVPSGRATGLSAVAPNLADYLNAGSNLVSSASKVVSSVSSILKTAKSLKK